MKRLETGVGTHSTVTEPEYRAEKAQQATFQENQVCIVTTNNKSNIKYKQYTTSRESFPRA